MSNMDVNARTSQQCHFSSIASLLAKPSIKPTLLYENITDIEEVCYITKSRYKFGSLEVYTHMNNLDDKNGTWQQIPDGYTIDMTKILTELNIRVVGSKEAYINKLIKLL